MAAPTLLWNTFLGSVDYDDARGIVVDGNGNIYVTGMSDVTGWGTPINPLSGGDDAFVAKLNSSGALVWNTFLGSTDSDGATGIALDGSGNIYVTGYSYATWGVPVMTYSGLGDAFVAKLNSSGTLIWNTFLGSTPDDGATGIALDGSGNVYVAGWSNATWGTPVKSARGWP